MEKSSILAYGASSHGGEDLKESEKFAGTRNVEVVEKFKGKILALTRLHHVESFLFQPVEELLPDNKEYKPGDMAEQRKYKEDWKKIYDQAREAYALIRRQFKEDSQAETRIKKADPSGRLNVLWKSFLDRYDNPVSKI
jgi:hypothetical protein